MAVGDGGETCLECDRCFIEFCESNALIYLNVAIFQIWDFLRSFLSFPFCLLLV